MNRETADKNAGQRLARPAYIARFRDGEMSAIAFLYDSTAGFALSLQWKDDNNACRPWIDPLLYTCVVLDWPPDSFLELRTSRFNCSIVNESMFDNCDHPNSSEEDVGSTVFGEGPIESSASDEHLLFAST